MKFSRKINLSQYIMDVNFIDIHYRGTIIVTSLAIGLMSPRVTIRYKYHLPIFAFNKNKQGGKLDRVST